MIGQLARPLGGIAPHRNGTPDTDLIDRNFLRLRNAFNRLTGEINQFAPTVYNVLGYGAKGDGIADDAPAINAVLAFSGAKTVYIPAGRYRLASKLVIPSTTILLMDRQATLLRHFAGLNITEATIVNSDQVGGNTDIIIEGGQFDVQTTVASACQGNHLGLSKVTRLQLNDIKTLNWLNASDIRLYDCVDVLISNIFAWMVSPVGNGDGIHIEGGSHYAITNCILLTGDDSICLCQQLQTVQATTNLADVVISNCYLQSGVANGVRIESSATGQTPFHRSVRHVRVSNCTIVGGNNAASGTSTYGGIQIADDHVEGLVSDISIANVYIDASLTASEAVSLHWAMRVHLENVTVTAPSGAGFAVRGCTDVSLVDCTVSGTRGATTPSVSLGDALINAANTNVRILGGTFTGATSHGIAAGQGGRNISGLQIIGAVIQGATTDGIRINNAITLTGTVIASNIITGHGGYGIRIEASCFQVQVIGNALHNNATGAISDVGTTTIAVHNLTGTSIISPHAYGDLPVGNGSWDSGAATTITITRALTVSGLLTGSAKFNVTGNDAVINAIAATGTNGPYLSITNTSGALISGVESSAGGTLFVGTAAYSVVFGTANAKSLHLATNNNVRLTIDSAGEATFAASVTGAYYRNLISSPAQITSNQNDYNPGAFGWLRLSTDASRDITGFTGGAEGRELRITNIGAFNIVLKEQVTSTAANQIITGTAADVTIATLKSALLKYDSVSSRWRIVQTY